jgi:hypothetical protein
MGDYTHIHTHTHACCAAPLTLACDVRVQHYVASLEQVRSRLESVHFD